MAAGRDGRTFVLAILGAGLAAALLRFPFGRTLDGPWFLVFAAVGLFAVGLPLILGEGALGQFRRRNAVDTFGPAPWKGLGFLVALGALALAAVLAVVAGWAARFFVLSFSESWYDDPGRHFRLLAAGPDALLATLAVLAVATGLAFRGVRVGLKAVVGSASVAAVLLLAGLAVWTNTMDGSAAGREALVSFDGDALDASLAFAAVLAGLTPALLATGAVATLSGHMHDRTMPREATLVALVSALAIGFAVLAVAALASSQGLMLGGGDDLDAFAVVPALFASVGGWEGGMMAGLFFGSLLLLALVALLVLIEVPATWLHERFDSWTEGRAVLASGLATYLVAVPLCFRANGVLHTSQALAWIVAPLAGMLVSVHVGWARPEVLDGFRVGDARHPLGKFLRPLLRFVHPPVLAFLFTVGLLGFVRAVGWADGSGGLWDLAP